MCGRYVVVTKVEKIEKRFNVVANEASNFIPNTNISHGNYAPVISSDHPNKLQLFQFGFTPHWAKKQSYVINARAEGDHNKTNDLTYHGSKGIINKPMFRTSIRSKRCLVVADCFIEGPEKEKLDKPYVVHLNDKVRPFAFAGIWDEWLYEGEIIKSFAIITTVANRVIQKIGHHRSPVILDRSQESKWLNKNLPLSDVVQLLQPYPSEKMNAYPISNRIKKPEANGLDLLDPVGEHVFPVVEYKISKKTILEGMGHSPARERRNKE
jgi:putative SOS response-associated peptidase YedK